MRASGASGCSARPLARQKVYASGGSARILRYDDALDGDDVLPGFRLPLNSLLAV